MHITCTIRKTETQAWVAEFFDGTRTEDQDFPFGKRIRDVHPGEFLNLIHQGRIRGRLQITRVEHAQRTVPVGSEQKPVDSHTIIWVHCPGEAAGDRNIPRKSHKGFRYDGVPEWAG